MTHKLRDITLEILWKQPSSPLLVVDIVRRKRTYGVFLRSMEDVPMRFHVKTHKLRYTAVVATLIRESIQFQATQCHRDAHLQSWFRLACIISELGSNTHFSATLSAATLRLAARRYSYTSRDVITCRYKQVGVQSSTQGGILGY